MKITVRSGEDKYEDTQVANWSVDQEAERVTIELATAVKQDIKMQIHIWYEGQLKGDLKGTSYSRPQLLILTDV